MTCHLTYSCDNNRAMKFTARTKNCIIQISKTMYPLKRLIRFKRRNDAIKTDRITQKVTKVTFLTPKISDFQILEITAK